MTTLKTAVYQTSPPCADLLLSFVDFMTYFFPHFLCMYFQNDKIVTNQLSHVSIRKLKGVAGEVQKKYSCNGKLDETKFMLANICDAFSF